MNPSTAQVDQAPGFSGRSEILEQIHGLNIRERIMTFLKGLSGSSVQSERRADVFWKELIIEKAVINAIMSGENPTMARIKADMEHRSDKIALYKK